MGKISALLQCLPHHEHAEKEQHNVGIDAVKGLDGRDLSRDQARTGPQEHDLPNLEPDPANPPDDYETEDDTQDDEGKVHKKTL